MSLLDLVGSPINSMPITAPGSIPDRYRQGYEDFYNQNPNDYQRIGGAAVSYVTTPQGETIQFSNTGGASNFRRYLESIGENPIANPGHDLLTKDTRPITSPMPIRRPGPIMGLQPAMPDYSSQFEKFGEQLTGFGDQMTGYQDALGSFNEQVGGMGKQFETISNRLDNVDKGLGSLGNQIASLENMQQAQPQQVMQPQRPTFNPFGFGGFGGFGGLGSLFGRRY
jgi:hypothetical protein